MVPGATLKVQQMEGVPVVTLTLAQRARVRKQALFFNISPVQAWDIEAGESVPSPGYCLKWCRDVLAWLLHEGKMAQREERRATPGSTRRSRGSTRWHKRR
jgi:hypothetical protein